jgi:hypothetical protein
LDIERAYSNIEKIIVYGFLTARITVEGHDLLIKNITDKELRNSKLLIEDSDIKKESLHSLSYCVAFLDGYNLLNNRDEHIYNIVKFLNKLPNIIVLKIIKGINNLNIKYSESVNFLEGFSYTDRSRYLWHFFNPYNRSSYTGISGLDSTGINSVQENWIIINKKLDEEDDYDQRFNNTLLIVGASNGKGAQNLQKSYNYRKRELKELRDEIKKHGHDLKRQEENDKKRDKWTSPLNTREDLVRELYRQMSGKKDRHDLYMDKWVEIQKEKAEAAKKKVEERQNEFRKKVRSIDMSDVEPSRPISTEELNRILKEKEVRDNRDRNKSEIESNREKSEQVLKKIGRRIIRSED